MIFMWHDLFYSCAVCGLSIVYVKDFNDDDDDDCLLYTSDAADE